MRGEHRLDGGRGERGPACKHLVGERPHRVDVRPVVGARVCGGLLWRHVGGRAERHAHRGERRFPRGLGHRLRDAEVGHEGVLPREQHVVRLDVAVHNAAAVRVGERVAHVAQDPHRLGDRELVFVREPHAQRLPLHSGHDVVEEVAVRAGGK